MRRAFFLPSVLLVVLALGAGAALVAACGSSADTLAPEVDAALGANQALGTPCDPSASPPCLPVTDVCSAAVCDPSSLRCVRVAIDAGPTCSGGNAPSTPCTGSACDAGADDAESDAESRESSTLDGASDGASDALGDVAVDAPPEDTGTDAGATSDAGGD